MENFSNDQIDSPKPDFNIFKKVAFYLLGTIILLGIGYVFFLSPPSDFKPGTIIQIEPGMSLHSISLRLKNENIIRSRVAFEASVILLGGEKHIKFSEYVFNTKLSVYKVAQLIVSNNRYMAPIVVTIPEGFDVSQIADAFAPKLPSFNRSIFLAKAKQGYMFPDTYYFFNGDNETKVLDSMNKNYEKKIAPIRPEILASGKTENQIIIMASIIEKEAKGDTDRGFISGILWRRISNGMPLQVDAVPETYKIKGLPKDPVDNPGLEAINAAIHPESSPYLYYLHDKAGVTHYATTFAEHKANKLKYLK